MSDQSILDEPTHYAHTVVRVHIPALNDCIDAKINETVNDIITTAFKEADDPTALAYFNASLAPVDFDYKQANNNLHDTQVFNLAPVFKGQKSDSVIIHFVNVAKSTLDIVKKSLLEFGAKNVS